MTALHSGEFAIRKINSKAVTSWQPFLFVGKRNTDEADSNGFLMEWDFPPPIHERLNSNPPEPTV